MSTREQSLREERLKKLEILKQKGLDPYPVETSKERQSIFDILKEFEKVESPKNSDHIPSSDLNNQAVVAGRVKSLRLHGKICFADLEDGSGRIQTLVRSDDVGNDSFEIFVQTVDEGDFIEIEGSLAYSKTGEKSVIAKAWKILTKSIRPIPSEYYGLKDIEQKLRKRYLDLLSNPETREMFQKKSVFWQTIREYLLKNGFLEVETPVLEGTPGGAEAEPFKTYHNALDREFFLRISLELPLKRLLVGGFEKVFEIGRIFRNEGISAEHLQDYTQMEFYWAYTDMKELMTFLNSMYQEVIQKTFGKLTTTYQGQEIDWSGEWPVVEFYDLFEKHVGISPDAPEDELRKVAEKNHIDHKDVLGKGRLLDLIYKKMIRPKFIDPQFMVRPPIEMEPLAKRDPQFPNRVQRLQIMAAGTELGKGFSELNDPLDQKARFEEQMRLRDAGDKEAQMFDQDFIEALEYGMPPASGFGLSERLFAVLMNKPIRELVLFPPMKENK